MRRLVAIVCIVSAILASATCSASAGVSLLITLSEGGETHSLRFGADTVSGDINYVFGSAHALGSRSSIRVGERISGPYQDFTDSKPVYDYVELTKNNHTLIFTQKDKYYTQYPNDTAYTEYAVRITYVDIIDNSTCRMRTSHSYWTEPTKSFAQHPFDEPHDTRVSCTWIAESSANLPPKASSVLKTCEGGVSTSERQTSSNFCITIYNQCGFSIMAHLARTDHKNGGSFEVGANPTTVCSDNLNWKYELDSYIPRPGG